MVFLTCLLKMRIYAVVISLSKAHHQNHTSKVYCLRLKHQGNLEEARPCGHPFRLHAEGNKFIITNNFLRDEAIDVGKVIIIELSSNGCRYLSNTGYHLVRFCTKIQLLSVWVPAIAEYQNIKGNYTLISVHPEEVTPRNPLHLLNGVYK